MHVFKEKKTTVFINFVVSLTIINDNPSITIVNIIVIDFFLKTIVFLKQLYKKGQKSFLLKRSFSKTIVIFQK